MSGGGPARDRATWSRCWFPGALVAVSLVAASRPARAGDDTDADVTFGHQLSALTDGRVTRDLSYAQMRAHSTFNRDESTGSTWDVRFAARAYHDFAPREQASEISVRELAVVRRTEHVQATVGFQEIVWGETLGFPVADIVSPRDLRDPLYLDTDWVRLPVLAARVQVTVAALRVQGVITPIPRGPELPSTGSPFAPEGVTLGPPRKFDLDRPDRDAEGGERVSFLVGAGVDLSAFLYTHWNRKPVYEAIPAPSGVELRPVTRRVTTPGVGVTATLGESVVLRLDSVLNIGEPVQARDLSAPRVVTESQTVLGGDVTLDSGWLFVLQGQYDRRGEENRAWVAARVQRAFFSDALELSLFGFRGIGNSDTWIEPSAAYHFLERVTATVRADFVLASPGDAGLLGTLDGKHRVLAGVRIGL